MRICLASIAASILVAVMEENPASAEILRSVNARILCVAEHDGDPVVDRDRLAVAITSVAGASYFLDGAGDSGMPNGTPDGVIKRISSTEELSEPAYAVYHSGRIHPDEANRPFGPDVPLLKADGTLDAHNAIVAMLGELGDLVAGEPVRSGPNLTYRIVQRPQAQPTPVAEELTDPRSIFRLDPPLIIACDFSDVGSADISTVSDTEAATASLPEAFRLRGDVKDLHEARSSRGGFGAGKPAQLSFISDDEKGVDAIGVNAVVGWNFSDKSGRFGLIPFLSFESQKIESRNNNDDDIFKISPGVLFNHYFEGWFGSVHSRLEASWIADIEHESDQAKLRFYIDPAFRLATPRPRGVGEPRRSPAELGPGILFGSELAPIGPFVFRPDLTFIGDISWVIDEGDNRKLRDADEYAGFGGEFSLGVRLHTEGILDTFLLTSGVRDLRLFGSIDQQDARHWFATLEYQPPELPYLGIGMDYVNGDNPDTLQKEDRLKLSFSLRF